MVQVMMASNPRRVRRMIIGGKIYEGGIEEAFAAQSMGNNLGGAGSPNPVPGEVEEASKD
jgi:hypothetical protein